MTLFDALRESHELQRQLLRQMLSTKRDAAKRESLFLQLRVELEAHAAAEERFFYAVLLMDDAGLSAARHGAADHRKVEKLCDELSVNDKSSQAWADKARELSEEVRDHLKEEERGIFQLGGRLIGDGKKASLAKRYVREVARMRRVLARDLASVAVGLDGAVKPAADSPMGRRATAKKATAKKATAKKAAAKKTASKHAAVKRAALARRRG